MQQCIRPDLYKFNKGSIVGGYAMKELEYLELQELGIEEIISYSKLQGSPTITILDDLNFGLFNQIAVWADELKLIFFIVKGTKKVAFIGNSNIAIKIAKVLQVKAQVMRYSLLKSRKLLGKIYTPKTKDNYVVQAFSEDGKIIAPFVNTDIKKVSCDILSKLNFRDFKYTMKIRGSGNNKVESLESIKELRRKFLKNGNI